MRVPKLTGMIAVTAIVAAGAAAGPTQATPSPDAQAAKTTVTMSGSTSVAPLAAKLARKYVATKGGIKFKLLQGGSDIGIADVARGRVTIGNSSRDPKSSDPGGLVFSKIARDGVCVVTNRANRLRTISQAQVQAIFSGRVRRWSDVPGATARGSIDLFVRTAASGTQDAFQNIFMGQNRRVAGSASTKASNGLVQQAVKSNKGAIGYLDFDFIGGTNALAYKGVACNLRNAKAGTYPGLRNFWMVTRGRPSGGAKKFISWIRSSGAARKIIGSNWVPLR